jgi:hypothetical protein
VHRVLLAVLHHHADLVAHRHHGDLLRPDLGVGGEEHAGARRHHQPFVEVDLLGVGLRTAHDSQQ